MNAAAGLVAYVAAVTWLSPAVLQRITRSGVTPRLGVAAWSAAVASILGAWVAAMVVLAVDIFDNVAYGSVLTFCLEALGLAGDLGAFRQVGSVVVIVLTAAGLVTTVFAIVRVSSGVVRSRRQSFEHARAARIVGRPSAWPDVFVVDADEATAYCVAGPPRAIVVTTAALDGLTEPELVAVLAHERAHLRGHHHLVLMVLRQLAAALPRLPLVSDAAIAVSRLLEMCADDVAARRHGSHPLLCGLIALVTVPSRSGALGAADTAVLARATRLVSRATLFARWRNRLVLSVAIIATVVAPVFAASLCHH